jgi:hypothetical protein
MNMSRWVNGSNEDLLGLVPRAARRAKRVPAPTESAESAEERRASIAASLDQLVARDRARLRR